MTTTNATMGIRSNIQGDNNIEDIYCGSDT